MKALYFIILLFVYSINIIYTNEHLLHKEMKQSITNTLEHFDKMGIDDSEFLNIYEIEYLNEKFESSRKNFDFKGKNIYFFGPGGLIFSDKQKYFNSLKNNNFNIKDELYVFNEFEKEKSGGYDAVIVFWNKRSYSPNDLIKRIQKLK